MGLWWAYNDDSVAYNDDLPESITPNMYVVPSPPKAGENCTLSRALDLKVPLM